MIKNIIILSIFITNIILSGCVTPFEKIDIDDILNSGTETYSLKVNQTLVINQKEKDIPIKNITLGRLDHQVAVFSFFSNKIQNTMHFTRPGIFRVTLSYQHSNGMPNAMQHTLKINVK